MTPLDRRAFLGTALASAGSCLALGQDAQVPPSPKPPGRNPLVYQFRIGGFDAWSISDGHLLFREGLGLMWPEDERPQMRGWLEARGERSDGIPLYINILVVRIGSEVVLFDAGFPSGNNPNLGWTRDALRGIGIAPEAVTAGFLSHAHADHLGGFVHGDKPAFPNAALYFLTEEHAFWHAPEPDFSRSKRNRAELPGMIRNIRRQFGILEPVSHMVKSGTQFFNGAVTIEAAPGHTAGHAIFRIRSGSDELLHLVDLAHHHGFMFEKPGWTIAFDHDPEQAVLTRRRVFAEAAAKRTRCYGFHVPWPGLGRILPMDAGYLWYPERWSWGS